ncbi:MAG: class I SAM-dependent methyltransferase, partial [Wenzhouxiangella sp.]|nr:class I SAM-dependent methyltransferase [Wenzhouxiangella sp.]
MTAPGFATPTPEQAARLREFFLETGYDEAGLRRSLGSAEPPVPQLRTLPRFLDLTRETNPFNQLVRWFLLGQPVAAEPAGPVVPGWFLETCLDLGLLRIEGDAYWPNALIFPYGRLLVASDCYVTQGVAAPYDHVLTINSSARHTLDFTVRRPSRATLDLGTGCGIQALVAAGHSETVVATDLNPRATSYAEFNARLNGLDNVQCLTGDLFEPVKGRRFDLIVCCPPFVLTPSKEFLYRDNDMALDGFCRHLAREAPRYLNDGGYFQMIVEWVNLE